MDKAKAYDEALERARQQRNDYQKELDKTDKNSQLAGLLRAGISAVEMIFPQLKENDNDRIRKCLQDIVNWFSFDSKFFTNNLVTKKDVIAYLEKQKEQKPAWSEEDEKDIAYIIEILDDCYASGRHDLTKTNHENLVNKLKSFHPIKQKWNEEDEKTINDACCFLGEYAGYIGSKNWGKSSMLFNIVDKLKSLYPY